MQDTTLIIQIPDYIGEYENAMRRLVNVSEDETAIFAHFFNGVQGLNFSLNDQSAIMQIANHYTVTHDQDALYAEYCISQPNGDINLVNKVYADFVFIFNYLHTFYRSNPFVSRLLQQAIYLDRKLIVKEIVPNGLIISIQ